MAFDLTFGNFNLFLIYLPQPGRIMCSIASVICSNINVREIRRGNKKWTIQRYRQCWASRHRMKINKTKTYLKSNMVLTNKLGVNTNFILFGLTRPSTITTSMVLNPRSTAMPLEANTLIITLPMRLLILHDMLGTKINNYITMLVFFPDIVQKIIIW